MAVKGWKSQPLECCWWPRVWEPGTAHPSQWAWGSWGLAGQSRLGKHGCLGYSAPAQLAQFHSIPFLVALPKPLCLWAGSPGKGGSVLSRWSGQVAQRTLRVHWNEGRAEWSVSFSGLTDVSILSAGGEPRLVTRKHGPHLTTQCRQTSPPPLGKFWLFPLYALFHRVWTPDSM